MKVIFGLLLIGLGYLGWGAYTELELTNLTRSRDVTRVEPRKVRPEENGPSSFNNAIVQKVYEDEGRRDAIFPWAKHTKEWEAVAILAAAAGFAGGLLRLFMEPGTSDKLHQNSPFLGLGLALILALILSGGDGLILEGQMHFKPMAVTIVGICAGVAWERAWKIIQDLAQRLKR